MAKQRLSLEVTFEGVKWWRDSDSSRYMVLDLWSSRARRPKLVSQPTQLWWEDWA